MDLGRKWSQLRLVTLLTVGLVSVIVSLQLLAYGMLNTVVFNNNNNNNNNTSVETNVNWYNTQ